VTGKNNLFAFPGLHPNSHTSTALQKYVTQGGWESIHSFKYVVQQFDSIETYNSQVYHHYFSIFNKNCSGSVSFLDIVKKKRGGEAS